MKTYVYLWQYLADLSLQREMLQTKVVEKNQTTYFMISTIFLKIAAFMR